jgi:hypothetical protein
MIQIRKKLSDPEPYLYQIEKLDPDLDLNLFKNEKKDPDPDPSQMRRDPQHCPTWWICCFS